MRPYVAKAFPRRGCCFVSAYPNAVPNALAVTTKRPASMTSHIQEWAKSGLINLGGRLLRHGA
ncbi:MAG: hypothetical protein R3C40_07685 [Parvularculaceae bacterium]